MNVKLFLATVTTALGLVYFSACTSTCEPDRNPDLGNEAFTVTYQNAAGTNYFSLYNPAGIVVFLDSTGGADPTPEYKRINPGYANGKFGPFEFTDSFLDLASNEINLPLLFGRTFTYDYYIKKDTYGVDTLSVSFLLGVNECNYYWEYIRYSRNGNPLPQYDNQANPDIVIVE
jgi:hypothetical protein